MIERLLAAERALGAGDLDQAERLFSQVAEADERNAIAVAGLAEIALRRAEPEQARALAQRALAIDPDEAAAARLLVTLDAPRAQAVAPVVPPGDTGTPADLVPPGLLGPPEPRRRGGFLAWLRRLLGRS